jgi:hypothetical protein
MSTSGYCTSICIQDEALLHKQRVEDDREYSLRYLQDNSSRIAVSLLATVARHNNKW